MTAAASPRRVPADRYGRRGPDGVPRRRRLRTYLALALLVVLALAAVVAVYQRSSTGVRVITRGFAVQSPQAVRIDFDVVKAADRDAVCAVRSRGEQGQEVGFSMVPVPRRTDGQRTTTVSYVLATTAPPFTGEVTQCQLG